MSSSVNALSYAGAHLNVAAVMSRALNVSNHSWEWDLPCLCHIAQPLPFTNKRVSANDRRCSRYGTAAQSLLEVQTGHLTVFGDDPFPEDKVPTVDITDVPR